MNQNQYFGYVRISTIKQDLDIQIQQLKERYPSISIYKEIVSTRKNQEQFENLMAILKEGDVLVVVELSRLARDLSSLIKIGEDLKKKGVRLITLKEGIDTDNKLVGNLLFQLLAVFAEFEREIIRERTIRSLEVKRKRGLMGGRPKISKSKISKALEDYDNMKMPINEILTTYSLSRSTFYRYLKNRNKNKE